MTRIINVKKDREHGRQRMSRWPKADLIKRIEYLVKRCETLSGQLVELERLQAEAENYELQKKRLSFLLTRHSQLEEWANSARRVVFSFPGVTNE